MHDESPPDRVTVEFRVENERYPFVGASDVESCTFELEEMIARGDGVYSEFFRVRDADTERILEIAEETPKVEATLLHEGGENSLFEFEISGGCIAVSLAEEGAYPRVVRGDDGEGTVVADCPGERARTLVRKILDDHTGIEVVAERTGGDAQSESMESTVVEAAHDVLTTRQRATLLTALGEGFYDWPREVTLEELATTLGTEESVVDARLHNCEQKLLAALFANGTLEAVERPVHPFSDTDTEALE